MAAGRKTYNFYCYYCHGYSGDANTLAARYLDPKPENFQTATTLTLAKIRKTLEEGVDKTAMKSFAGRLDKQQRHAVASFVNQEFIRCKKENTRYHTALAGWPDHERRYGLAYPFVKGTVDHSKGEVGLDPGEKTGLELYRKTCVVCHGLDPFRQAPALTAPVGVPGSPSASEVKINSSWSGKLKPQRKLKPQTHSEHSGEQPGDSYASAHDIAPAFADMTPGQQRGQRLYQDNCALCHAADGSGKNWVGAFLTPGPTDFLAPDAATTLTDQRMVEAMTHGLPQTSMPAFKDVLSAREMAFITAYIRRAFFHEWEISPQSE